MSNPCPVCHSKATEQTIGTLWMNCDDCNHMWSLSFMTPAPRNAIWVDSKTSIVCYLGWVVISFVLMKALDLYVWIITKTGRIT